MKKKLINYYFDSYEEYESYKPYLKAILGAMTVSVTITILNLFIQILGKYIKE